jgi:hypothetical protein
MEVEASWLDPESRRGKDLKKDKKKRPPPIPGGAKANPPPMPVERSLTEPPPRRQTMEVKAEWLEEAALPAAEPKKPRARASIVAPPPAPAERKPSPPIPRED